ncbi:MAG: hypothetical protein KA807_07425 [Prolixibacteraceae bacterium]|nr:hypothetical protein [Prolixibacteraceae bacterium]
MAKIKDLKKDIRFITEQLLIDALEVSEIIESKQKQEILDIIVEIAGLHNDLISRANHPDGKDNPKLIKKYYNDLIVELLEKSDKIYDKLNQLIPEK